MEKETYKVAETYEEIKRAYEEAILQLIDNRDDFTRSDLQGVVSALVMKMLEERVEKPLN